MVCRSASVRIEEHRANWPRRRLPEYLQYAGPCASWCWGAEGSNLWCLVGMLHSNKKPGALIGFQGHSFGASRQTHTASGKVRLAKIWSLVPVVLDPLKTIVTCHFRLVKM